MNFNPIKWVASKMLAKGKKICSFCQLRHAQFSGMKPVMKRGKIAVEADRARACIKCYRQQFAEEYPGEKLPV